MKLLYLSKYSSIGPSSRYRIYQYLPYLAEYGIDVDVRPLLKDRYFGIIKVENFIVKNLLKMFYAAYRYIIRFFDVLDSKKYDLVVVEHQAFPYLPFSLDYIMKILNKNIILEFDDAIYLTHPKKMPKLIKVSKAVIVGNDFLKEYAVKYNKNVKVVPTVIDMRRYPPPLNPLPQGEGRFGQENQNKAIPSPLVGEGKGEGDRIIICWIGLAYNIDYLKQLTDVFRKLSDKIFLKIISNKGIEIEGVNIIFKKWSIETEVEEIQGSHIGIMPLNDDEWSRGKCGLKILQYMAAGIPSVASPVGVNKEIISDGVNGFLASSEDEWYEKLLKLCDDPELRKRMGNAGRKTVEDKYSINIWAPRLAEIYKEGIT
ncbi:MAG: glycosyltransferase family 4 protein [Nitrospirae bacterium]|nr:glycosyltransferase family 4 protein [Nitrospirota bacterium]